jgi:hypothetical protein
VQDEFIKLRVLWEKTGDLRYVWRVVATCLRGEAAMPPWVENYLIDVAAGIEAGKFPQRKQGAPRQIDSLADERFGIAFIREILKDGATAGKARESAAIAVGLSPDGKELSQKLKDFFDLDALPDGQQQGRWKHIVVTWLLNHPTYVERYDDLPTNFDFRKLI